MYAWNVVSRVVLKFQILYGGCSTSVARLCSTRPCFSRLGRTCLLWTFLRSKASCRGSKWTLAFSPLMALMEKPQHKAWMASPSGAKGRFLFLSPASNFWRTITQAVSHLSMHTEKLYCFPSSKQIQSLLPLDASVLSLPDSLC